MSGERKSEALGVDAVPLAGRYKHDEEIIFFEVERKKEEVDLDHLPLNLSRFLVQNRRLLPPPQKYSYATIHSVKPRDYPIESSGEYIVNIFFHPYVFLDAGFNHQTCIHAAIFTNSNKISNWSLRGSKEPKHIQVNPDKLESCWLEITMHSENGAKKLSPDNSFIFLREEIPINIFYSLCIVLHERRPDRLLICKHVIALDTSFPFYQHFTSKAFDLNPEARDLIENLINLLQESIEKERFKPNCEAFRPIFQYFDRDYSRCLNLVNYLIPSIKRDGTLALMSYLEDAFTNMNPEYRNTQLYYFYRLLAQNMIDFLTEL